MNELAVCSLFAALKDFDGSSGVFEAVASTPSIDRDFESIAAGALFWIDERVPVHLQHGGPLAGSATPFYVDSALHVRGAFAANDAGQEARSLVLAGHLRGVSVMFLPLASRPGSGAVRKIITSGELLAVDLVTVPSNRDSRVLTARSFNRTPERAGVLSDARTLLAALSIASRSSSALSDARALIAASRQPTVSDDGARHQVDTFLRELR